MSLDDKSHRMKRMKQTKSVKLDVMKEIGNNTKDTNYSLNLCH